MRAGVYTAAAVLYTACETELEDGIGVGSRWVRSGRYGYFDSFDGGEDAGLGSGRRGGRGEMWVSMQL